MHLLTIGLNHKSAPLSLRERLSLPTTAIESLLNSVTHSTITSGIQECTVISTCNRFEIYLLVETPALAIERLINDISQLSGLPIPDFRQHVYILEGLAAVEHLMQVASGLDSLVLGEAQILGQLVTAHQMALKMGSAKPILARLFQTAIHTGKRARTETAIGQNSASISSVAVQVAKSKLDDLSQKTAVVLGAGEMGRLTIQALLKQGIDSIYIVNRSLERAEQIAQDWQYLYPTTRQLSACSLADLPQCLTQADIIITSTGATEPILNQTMVADAMLARPKRPLLIIDIGLPRDVEATVADLSNVHLYNLDNLEDQVTQNLQARAAEIPEVEAIIRAEVADFWQWYRARSAIPTITAFRSQFEAVKEHELQRTLNRLQHLDPKDQDRVAELAHRLVNKFLHQPTVHLKTEAGQGNGAVSKQAIQQLFSLECNPNQ